LGHVQPTQQAKQAAFAGAVVADQADARLGQIQRQSRKNRVGAALQGGIADMEQGRGRGLGYRIRMVWNGRIAW